MNNTTKHIILILLCCLLVSFGRPTLCAAPSRRPAPCATSSTRPAPCATSASAPQYNFRSTSTFHTTGSYSSFRSTQSYSSSRSGHNASAPTSRSSRSTYVPHSVSRYSVSRPSASHNSVPRPSASHNSVPRYSAPIHRQSDQHLRSYGGGLTNPPTTRSYSSARSYVSTPSATSEYTKSVSIPSQPTRNVTNQTKHSQPQTTASALRITRPAELSQNMAYSELLPWIREGEPLAVEGYEYRSILSTTLPTTSTGPKKAGGIYYWNGKIYDEDGNEIEIGKVEDGIIYDKEGNIIGYWHDGHFTTQGEPVDNPVGSPLCLIPFAITYAFLKRRKLQQHE